MTQLAKVYGGALYELCAEENLDKEVLEQAETVAELFVQNPDYVKLLDAPTLPKTQRITLIDEALGGKAQPYLVNFIKVLCERGEVSAFTACIAAYRDRYYEAHGILRAEAVSAVALSEKQKQALCEKLKTVTGKEILLTCKVDPAVMGGIRLSMDGKQFDNTVKHRLDDLRAALVGTIA